MARSSQTGGGPQASEGLTVIGAAIRVNGRIEGDEDLRVEGRVEGSIALSQTVFVDAGGVVVAEVVARDIVVSGVVVGNVKANNCITLHAGARVVGDLDAPRVVIEEGAAFRGNVAMGEGPATSAGVAKRATRAPSRAATRGRATPPARNAGGAARAASIAKRAPSPAAERPKVDRPKIAPIRPGGDDDEVTVVVRHAEVAAKSAPKKAAKKKTKKSPPRARMPKPGKRRISRR